LKSKRLVKVFVTTIVIIVSLAVSILIYWESAMKDYGYEYNGVKAIIEYNDLNEPISESEGRTVFSKYCRSVNSSYIGNRGFSLNLFPEQVNGTGDKDGTICVNIIWETNENITVILYWDSDDEQSYEKDKSNLFPYIYFIIGIFKNEFNEEPDNISYEKMIIEHQIKQT